LATEFWVVTRFLPEDVILRLRVAYESYEDACRLFFDARMRHEREFQMLGTLETHVTTLWKEDHEYRLHMDDLPLIWTAQFRQMARCWAAVCWVIECGSVTEVRYAAAPRCLRDCLEFPDLVAIRYPAL
jgi:hypothetical protein